jgi:hypothetical protein
VVRCAHSRTHARTQAALKEAEAQHGASSAELAAATRALDELRASHASLTQRNEELGGSHARLQEVEARANDLAAWKDGASDKLEAAQRLEGGCLPVVPLTYFTYRLGGDDMEGWRERQAGGGAAPRGWEALRPLRRLTNHPIPFNSSSLH